MQGNSPAIDAGNNADVPPESYDLDGDNDTGETLPVDLTGNPRVVLSSVDMGAYEARFATVSSITRSTPSSSTTNATSVTFQVVFAQSLSGIAISDFAAIVVSGGVDSASVTDVSGSGATYSVTANTGTGDGVLRLDVPATAQANVSGLLVDLLPYSSGESYTIDDAYAPFMIFVIPYLRYPCSNSIQPITFFMTAAINASSRGSRENQRR